MRQLLLILPGVLLACAGCVDTATVMVSPTDQALLRDTDQLHLRLQSAVIDSRAPRVQRYLEQLAARITTVARELDQQGLIKSPDPTGGSNGWMFARDIEFHLMDHVRVSSFSPGGKHVYVYNGLFMQCRGEDELAAVLCHQFAHLYTRMAQQTIRRQPGEVGDSALLVPFATMRIAAASDRAADEVAFKLFSRGGWDPTRYGALELRLADQAGDPGMDRMLLRQRAEEGRRLVDGLPDAAREWARPPVADDARFAQIQGEVKSMAGSRPPTRMATLLLSSFPSCLNLADTPGQVAARAELFPPSSPTGGGNKWGKGFPGS